MLRLQRLAQPAGRTLIRSLSSTPASLSSSSSSSSTPVPPVVEQTTNASPAVPQSPNYAGTWSTSQNPRPAPHSNPRFEQIDYDYQPAPLSAMELVNNEPIIMSDKRIAVCDGGGGPLGHPKIYINLDKPGPRPCG
ncbi:hypothetical protein DL93DRAFT_2086392, partial [Clavulina sp. PMI_390]